MSDYEKPKHLINMTDTYQTRAGLPVRVLAIDLNGETSVAAAIQLTASSEQLVRLNKYGEYYDGTEHVLAILFPRGCNRLSGIHNLRLLHLHGAPSGCVMMRANDQP